MNTKDEEWSPEEYAQPEAGIFDDDSDPQQATLGEMNLPLEDEN